MARRVSNKFLMNKLITSVGGEYHYPNIPHVRGRHLTDQQHDVIFQIIDNLKKKDRVNGKWNLDKFFTMGISGARRAGKTSLIARLIPLVESYIRFDEIDPTDPQGKRMRYKKMDFLLGSMTQGKAVSLYWDAIMKYSDSLGLGYKSSTKNAQIVTPRGNKIVFKSLRDLTSASAPRGDAYVLVMVDEVQNIVYEVLDDFLGKVVKPATSDYGGTTLLLGTLPHVPSGEWYDIIQGNKKESVPYHYLDYKKNYFISQDARELMVIDERRRYGEIKGKESAWFKREWYGIPVWDEDSLVFNYKAEKNDYKEIEIPKIDRRYAIGVDLGYDDADAFAVMCYSEKTKLVYLVEEHVRRHQDVTSCCEMIKELCKKYNDPLVIVDSGSIGKKVMEEMISRHGVTAEPADKTDKKGWIRITRQQLHAGNLKIKKSSYACKEMSKIEYDEKQEGWRKGGFHPDLMDAILYSYKFIWHTMHMFWSEIKEEAKPQTKLEAILKDVRLQDTRDASREDDDFGSILPEKWDAKERAEAILTSILEPSREIDDF